MHQQKNLLVFFCKPYLGAKRLINERHVTVQRGTNAYDRSAIVNKHEGQAFLKSFKLIKPIKKAWQK